MEKVVTRLGGRKLDVLDAFSGSGAVSRFLKRHARRLWVNDLEAYARAASECFLANREEFPSREYAQAFAWMGDRLRSGLLEDGIISRLYAPQDDAAIKAGERVFYTARNARFLDTARSLVGELPPSLGRYFLGPLLSEASVHANTAGVFKGFYKNTETGLGQFGGRKGDALTRIKGDIELRPPVLSRFSCESRVLQGDANLVCLDLPEVDLAYLDPPYNQHPYGSNYFMLNLLVEYEEPEGLSRVSGIPKAWRRSAYNRAAAAAAALAGLVDTVRARFVLVSFNSDGFIKPGEMQSILEAHGRVETLHKPYNTFRGSRNLHGRDIHVREYLYVLEKDR